MGSQILTFPLVSSRLVEIPGPQKLQNRPSQTPGSVSFHWRNPGLFLEWLCQLSWLTGSSKHFIPTSLSNLLYHCLYFKIFCLLFCFHILSGFVSCSASSPCLGFDMRCHISAITYPGSCASFYFASRSSC